MKSLLGPIVLALGLSACGTASRWVANTAEVEDRSIPAARHEWQRAHRPPLHKQLSSLRIAYVGETSAIVAGQEVSWFAENLSASIASGPSYMEPSAQIPASAEQVSVANCAPHHPTSTARSTADGSGPRSQDQVSVFGIARCQKEHGNGTAIRAENEDSTIRPMNKISRTAFILGCISLALVLLSPVFIILSVVAQVLGIIGLVQALVRKERGLGFAIGAILIPFLAIAIVYGEVLREFFSFGWLKF